MNKKIKKDYKKSSWKVSTEKNKQYGCEFYKNLLEDEKTKLGEYRRKYYRMRKNALS